MPSAVAQISTEEGRNTMPSTTTASARPIENRCVRRGTRTINRSATTSEPAYSSGCQAWLWPSTSSRQACGATATTTPSAAAATSQMKTSADLGRDHDCRCGRAGAEAELTLFYRDG